MGRPKPYEFIWTTECTESIVKLQYLSHLEFGAKIKMRSKVQKQASRISRWSQLDLRDMNIHIPGSNIQKSIKNVPKLTKQIQQKPKTRPPGTPDTFCKWGGPYKVQAPREQEQFHGHQHPICAWGAWRIWNYPSVTLTKIGELQIFSLLTTAGSRKSK